MSSFDRWQTVNGKRIVANKQFNASFVINGFPTITITSTTQSGGVYPTKTASVVNKQEKDIAYIYTNLADTLTIGSTWTAKTLTWIIAEQEIIIKDVKWNKYLAYKCNVHFGNNYGYFKGPEKSYINVSMFDNFAITSQQKPILVMGGDPYNIDDKVLISGRAWMIQEKDNISTPGITYYSLSTTTMSKDAISSSSETANTTNVDITTPTIVEGVNIVHFDTEITLATESAYFEAPQEVEITSLSSTSVVFKIPYGITETITIKTKTSGTTVTSYYKAVI